MIARKSIKVIADIDIDIPNSLLAGFIIGALSLREHEIRMKTVKVRIDGQDFTLGGKRE